MSLLKQFPKISIVTVNYNNGQYLEEAMLSVLNQNYPNLEYIVVDGGSTDNSVEIIKKYEHRLAWWISEKDEGQYHAVQKGFDKSTGDIMAWINSDDLYVPNAFYAVAEILDTFPDVSWLMGIPREYTPEGVMLSRITLPWGRWSKHRFYMHDFQFIQQESSFWKRSLWEAAGSKMDTGYKYAGDMELWTRFFRHQKLHTTIATLAGFRHRADVQRSVEFRSQYLQECTKAIRRELEAMPFLKRLAYKILKPVSLVTAPFFFYDIPFFNAFFPWWFGIPKPIGYDVSNKKYIRQSLLVKLPPLFMFNRQVHRKMFKKK